MADWAVLSGCAVGDKKTEMLEGCEWILVFLFLSRL